MLLPPPKGSGVLQLKFTMNSASPSQRNKSIRQMTLIGLMTALICIMAPFSLPLPFSPVPLSLCTFAIYLAILLLSPKNAVLCVLLYLLLGLVGMPVFSGFTGGIGRLLGPTGGYLVGYLLLAAIGGFFTGIGKYPSALYKLFTLLGMILGTFSCYLLGTLWLCLQSNLSFLSALLTTVVPFLPGDFLKMAAALVLGSSLRSRLQQAGVPS